MVEYTVETLVHLYDSLNAQIESEIKYSNDFMQVSLNPDIRKEVKAKIETAYKITENRLKKLVSMRDDVEELLNKILKAEVSE